MSRKGGNKTESVPEDCVKDYLDKVKSSLEEAHHQVGAVEALKADLQTAAATDLPNKAAMVKSASNLLSQNKSLCQSLEANQSCLQKWHSLQQWKCQSLETLGEMQDLICNCKGNTLLLYVSIFYGCLHPRKDVEIPLLILLPLKFCLVSSAESSSSWEIVSIFLLENMSLVIIWGCQIMTLCSKSHYIRACHKGGRGGLPNYDAM